MKSDKKIFIAFCLNLFFAVVEFIGGILTNSISIMGDAVHDLADALSIGVSMGLEKLSKKKPDNLYTYGYARYSIFGAFFTTSILIIGSIFVIYNAILRIINPQVIEYNGMIIMAIFGVSINTDLNKATFCTPEYLISLNEAGLFGFLNIYSEFNGKLE